MRTKVAEAKPQDAVRDLPGLASSNGVLASVSFADAITALFDFAGGASARQVTFGPMGIGGAMGQGAVRNPRCSAATRPVAGPCDGHIPRATNCRARCVVGRAQLPDALLGRACTPPGFMPIRGLICSVPLAEGERGRDRRD